MFADPEDPEIPSWLWWLPFESFAFLIFWKKKPEGRRTTFIGLVFLAVTIILVLGGLFFRSPNKPAAGKAGIACLLAIEHHWPGLPEPGRSVA